MIKKFILGSLELLEKEIVVAFLESKDAEASYRAALLHGREKRRESTPAATSNPLTITFILYVVLLDRHRPVGRHRFAFHAPAAGVHVPVFRGLPGFVREFHLYPARWDSVVFPYYLSFYYYF
jgi:hypothetical protein